MRIKKVVEVKCSYCEKLILKELKEYKRRLKRGKDKFYCNINCAAMVNPGFLLKHKELRDNPEKAKQVYIQFLKPYAKNKQDEFSSFRYFINKAKSRKNKKFGEYNITLEYLKEIWEKQNGICPYTRLKMDLCINTQSKNIKSKINKASLDRIDSSKGYLQGNVEFVCLGVNYAKNGFPKEQAMDFFNKIMNNKLEIKGE